MSERIELQMWNSKEYKKQEARPEIDMLPADFRELGEAAQPLYQLLKAKYTPHHRIIVDYDGVKVASDEIFCPLT